MSLTTITQSRVAFERTTQAIEAVGEYLTSYRIDAIQFADTVIKWAVEADPTYAIALLYRGIIHDLGGKPADAVDVFEKILNGTSESSLVQSAKFNLGVSYYHRYSHHWLEKAETYFKSFIEDSPEYGMKLLAQAHLAQVHAMWMRPSSSQDKESSDTQKHIKDHFDESEKFSGIVAKEIREQHKHARAVALNARGMAYMYLTDWLPMNTNEKQKKLNQSLDFLKRACQSLSKDWANTCDLASVNLRLGVVERDEKVDHESVSHFQEAKELLDRVINELRPKYGFALFEAGILHRVWGKFPESIDFLSRAKEVPELYRDVSDAKVDKELKAAERRSLEYPLT